MKKMLPFFLALGLLSLNSCKKAIENKEQAILMDIITNGSWIVENYAEDSLDMTGDFTGYTFRFSSDGTVTGSTSDSTTLAAGTWSGDISSRTITSDFPSAVDPVIKLNGTWKITDSGTDYVKAAMSLTGMTKTLYLRKKS